MRAKTYIMIAIVVVLGLTPRASSAGLRDILYRAAIWLGSEVKIDESGGEKPAEDEAPKEKPGEKGTPGMCQVPREQARIICDANAGFLCVNTPPGSVDGDSMIVKGTIDRLNSAVASIRVAVQNEYTKKTTVVDTSSPVSGDCWDGAKGSSPFCLGKDGRFSALVPLAEKGPHTIFVSASRLSGKSEEKRVRTSRVIPFKFTDENVKFDPDVRTAADVDGDNVSVKVGLLGDCKFCDFIGASTGGVTITVENSIKDEKGHSRHISCKTSVEQGGQGQFVVGMPVGNGTNEMTVRACNAALEKGGCPQVGKISFKATGDGASGFSIISPPPSPTYDPASYPTIKWEFSLDGDAQCVKMRFNREAEKELCRNESGRFATELKPRTGINVASISKDGSIDDYAWTFGHGSVKSPFGQSAGMIEVPGAAQLKLPVATVNNIVMPLLNNFFKSDELAGFIKGIFSGSGGEDEGSQGDALPVSIPKCEESGGLGKFIVELVGTPKIASAEIGGVTFSDGKLAFSLTLKGIRVRIDLIPDGNRDGKPDNDPLPLFISFRYATFDIELLTTRDEGGNPLFLVSSPHDDCSFKKEAYCKHVPTALVPGRYFGDANRWAGFISCDESVVKSGARDACEAINALDAELGIITETLIDLINNSIYCGGSSALTGMARNGISLPNLALGCRGRADCKGTFGRILAPVKMPVVIKLTDGTAISQAGVTVSASFAAGGKNLFDKTPEEFRVPGAGMIGMNADPRTLSAPAGDIGLALSLDAVDALLYAAAAQGDGRDEFGIFDFDIDESFFKDIGIDFVKECDEFKSTKEQPDASMACQVRPRIAELLGTGLTTYDYFKSVNQPLMLTIRGNRALGPVIRVATLEDLPVVVRQGGADAAKENATENAPSGSLLELELGGINMTFYALEVDSTKLPDKFGNLTVKRDASGKAVIHSMKPEESDPLNGQIISFDLSLLLGLEVGPVAASASSGSGFSISIRPIADRSRAVLVPIEGTNATTVPSTSLAAMLDGKLKWAIVALSAQDKAINVPIPGEIAIEMSDSTSLFGALGLKKISFGDKGPSLDFDPKSDALRIAIEATITQILHAAGAEVQSVLPAK